MLGILFESLSPWHIMLVLFIALLFYGKRLPEAARSLGKAVNEFKRGLRDVQDQVDHDEPVPPPQKLQPPRSDSQLEPPKPIPPTDAQETERVRETPPSDQR